MTTHPLSARASFWWGLLWHPWWLSFLILWSVFSNAATIRDNFLTPELQKRLSMPELFQSLPAWGWQVWLIGFLSITLAMVLEGAYRKWAAEHQQVLALTKQIADLTKLTVDCKPYGIPQPFQAGQRWFLIVPEVTITNQSLARAAAINIILWLLTESAMEIRCSPESQRIPEWEQSPRSGGFPHLAVPLNLPAQSVKIGYVAFRLPDNPEEKIDFTPRRNSTQGMLCRIEFVDMVSQEVLNSEEIQFHGI